VTSNFLIGISIAAILAIPAWRFQALDATGAVGAILVGTIIFGLGGLAASVVLVTFFVSGSLLSALPKTRDVISESQDRGRNWKQVVANGLVPMISVIVATISRSHEALWMHVYCGSVAAACADSWATEAGTRFGRADLDILTGNPLPAGLSGGISLFGTLASLAGAGIIVIAAAIPLGGLRLPPTNRSLFAILIGGFSGSTFDSILGSSIQAKFRCSSCHQISETPEHCSKPATVIAGYKQIRNNTVNFAASAIGAVFTALLLDFS